MNPLHVISRIIDSLASIDDDTAAAPPIANYQSLGEPNEALDLPQSRRRSAAVAPDMVYSMAWV